jgi:hypothetical protein
MTTTLTTGSRKALGKKTAGQLLPAEHDVSTEATR